MASDDLTVKILIEIRDEIRSSNVRLDQTNARLDQTNARLDQTNARLDRVREDLVQHIVETELRTATAITELTGTVRRVHAVVADRLELRDRVERCERDIAELKGRVP